MLEPLNFTQPPVASAPRRILAPIIARGRMRDISHAHRAVPPIEAITVYRCDAAFLGMRGGEGSRVAISLARVKWLERAPVKFKGDAQCK